MKFNSKDLAVVAERKGQIEGRLQHRPPPGTFRDTVFRDRYFKLVNNLLFYFRLTELGQIDNSDKEPAGVLVLENYSVRVERDGEVPFGFGLLFLDEPDKLHVFTARSDEDANKWVNKIRTASYEQWKNRLNLLKDNIIALKDAKKAIRQEKEGKTIASDDTKPVPSPYSERRNPFLPSAPALPPRPPPPQQSPRLGTTATTKTNKNNNSPATTTADDLIKL